MSRSNLGNFLKFGCPVLTLGNFLKFGCPILTRWVGAKSLYALATCRPQDLGQAQWVRRAPLAGGLVLLRQPKRGRCDRSLNGTPRRSRQNLSHAKRARKPWLLMASPSLQTYDARQVVGIYNARMQIEDGFRDTKSVSYGLGIAKGRYTSFTRAANLLLVAALAAFILWLIGCMAKSKRWDYNVRVNSTSRHPDYYTLFIARLVIRHLQERLPRDCLEQANLRVNDYMRSMGVT